MVERALEVVQIRPDLNSARQRFRRAAEVGQRREREVDLRHGSVGAIVLNLSGEVRRQLGRFDQPQEGGLRIGAREDQIRLDRLAAGRYPANRAVADDNLARPASTFESRRRRPVRPQRERVRSAPGPPLTRNGEPPASCLCASRISSISELPADRGPSIVPVNAGAAIVARTSSCSNHSCTRSATGIGPQRSRRCASRLPSDRNARAVFSRFQRSAAPGLTIDGGAYSNADASTEAVR